MTIASKLNDVTQLLLTTIRALPEANGFTVFAGPPFGRDYPNLLITVGDDGDPESELESTFEQSWANFNRTRKRETGDIPCAVISWHGSTDMESQQSAAALTFSAVESALLALISDDLDIEIVSGSSRPVQNERGAGIQLPFTVRYTTTL